MIFISVVSHGHGKLISELGALKIISQDYQVILTDNIGEQKLKDYCALNKISYIKNDFQKGFGENNNQNFKYALTNLGMSNSDYFLVLNPDVCVTSDAIKQALLAMTESEAQLATINLMRNKTEPDANIRNFPTIRDFFESYLYKRNRTIINKSSVPDRCYVDWASGSFLMFNSGLYHKISGFNTDYFMYCEDLDICRRALSREKQKVLYIGDIKAQHIAAHNNRKFFSKHFLWHVQSVFRYCFVSKY